MPRSRSQDRDGSKLQTCKYIACRGSSYSRQKITMNPQWIYDSDGNEFVSGTQPPVNSSNFDSDPLQENHQVSSQVRHLPLNMLPIWSQFFASSASTGSKPNSSEHDSKDEQLVLSTQAAFAGEKVPESTNRSSKCAFRLFAQFVVALVNNLSENSQYNDL